MKITLTEHEGCFAFSMEAEGLRDAALLTRLAINKTKELRSLDVFANPDGSFTGSCVLGKVNKVVSTIPSKFARRSRG